MKNPNQYHWRSRTPAFILLGVALVLGVFPLSLFATRLGFGVIGVLSIWLIMLWLVWRQVVLNHRSGSWITPTRLVVYRETDKRSFDLADISHLSLVKTAHRRLPTLHFKDGHEQRLPISALPRVSVLKGWLSAHNIPLIDSDFSELIFGEE